MSITWRAGFMRLWIACSILWLLFIVGIAIIGSFLDWDWFAKGGGNGPGWAWIFVPIFTTWAFMRMCFWIAKGFSNHQQ